jgi:hypothetical protein
LQLQNGCTARIPYVQKEEKDGQLSGPSVSDGRLKMLMARKQSVHLIYLENTDRFVNFYTFLLSVCTPKHKYYSSLLFVYIIDHGIYEIKKKCRGSARGRKNAKTYNFGWFNSPLLKPYLSAPPIPCLHGLQPHEL